MFRNNIGPNGALNRAVTLVDPGEIIYVVDEAWTDLTPIRWEVVTQFDYGFGAGWEDDNFRNGATHGALVDPTVIDAGNPFGDPDFRIRLARALVPVRAFLEAVEWDMDDPDNENRTLVHTFEIDLGDDVSDVFSVPEIFPPSGWNARYDLTIYIPNAPDAIPFPL